MKYKKPAALDDPSLPRTGHQSMIAGKQHLTDEYAARKPGRALQIIVILLSLISVMVFRVLHDRKRASDSIKYSDMHEAVEQISLILNKTPQRERLSTSIHFLNSESPGMRYAAVDSLENAQGDGIADALQRAYLDSSTEVRKRVLDLLPKFDVQRGYRLQLAALRDEDCWVRDHAIILLSSNSRQRHSYVDMSAVPSLIRTMTDVDPNVAPLAIPILMKITGTSGKGWRYSVLESDAVKSTVKARWLNWWAAHSAVWPHKEYESLAPELPTRSDPAPDFLVKDIDGHRISLYDMRGKVVILNFWGTWCPPCQEEMPTLVEMDDKYHDKGLATIGIAVKEKSVDALRDWCSLHGVKYPQVLDAETISHVYGDCFEVPVTVLIDKHGMLRRRWDGERDYETFRAAVERLLKE